jgi:hypothetical protein
MTHQAIQQDLSLCVLLPFFSVVKPELLNLRKQLMVQELNHPICALLNSCSGRSYQADVEGRP